MRVRDLMQADVRTVDVSTRLDVVERLMREEVIRHVPVLDGGKIAGMITQRDMLRAGLAPALSAGPVLEQEWLAETRAHAVMTRHVIHAHPEADLADAVALMVRERVGCLPVVDDGRIVGMLTDTDCLRYLSRLLQSGAGD
jgi:CBS domain-containing protein